MTDINSHWAKGYIKFCESQGIIAGYGDNTFKPDATVTGVEAAKMLLVLAGYDADKAGLVGSTWCTNTLKYCWLRRHPGRRQRRSRAGSAASVRSADDLQHPRHQPC